MLYPEHDTQINKSICETLGEIGDINNLVAENISFLENSLLRESIGRSSPLSSSLISTSDSFRCIFCNRAFDTKIGLGQHKRHEHPHELALQCALGNDPSRNTLWCNEEVALLAARELALGPGLGQMEICRKLQAQMLHRTVESIRGLRKGDRYKSILEKLRNERPTSQPSPERAETSLPNNVNTVNRGERAGTSLPNNVNTVNEGEIEPGDSVPPEDDCYYFALEQNILNYLSSLPSLRYNNHRFAPLDSLISDFIGSFRSEQFMSAFSELLANLLSIQINPDDAGNPSFSFKQFRENNFDPPSAPPLSNRQKKKKDFNVFQYAFKKNRARAVRSILDGDNSIENIKGRDVEEFWKNIMAPPNTDSESTDLPPPFQPSSDGDLEFWAPITIEEIHSNFPADGTAVGPDGVHVGKLRALPRVVLCKILNLFILAGRVPSFLTSSKTIFLPKSETSNSPSQLRPISMASTICRLYHKILANRTQQYNNYPNQYGFRNFDGVASVLYQIDFLLKHARTYKKGMNLLVSFLDLSKAFDSITHEGLWRALSDKGLPASFISYLKHFYSHARTALLWRGHLLSWIHPSRGVRQGDPLSPVLFNIVMEAILQNLNPFVGLEVDEECPPISHLAYADDVVLVASSPHGLQENINLFVQSAERFGLQLNISKSKVLFSKWHGKSQKSFPERTSISIKGELLKCLGAGETIDYMGMKINHMGILRPDLRNILDGYFRKVLLSPTKPQQKLWILKQFILPRLSFALPFIKHNFKAIESLDIDLRRFVRKVLHLPRDSPNSHIHASVRDGGLGVSDFRYRALVLRRNKIKNFIRDSAAFSPAMTTFYTYELNRLDNLLIISHEGEDINITSTRDINNLHRKFLLNNFDGRDLDHANDLPFLNGWVDQPNNLIKGHDYIDYIKLRVNALPTKARGLRGRQGDRLCRHGCGKKETLYHMLQACPKTHGLRIKRHNNIVNFLANTNRGRGKEVHLEPRVHTSTGLRKPDLLIIDENIGTLVDVQITNNDGRGLSKFNTNKINYYKHNLDLIDKLKEKHHLSDLNVFALTVSYKGFICKKSFTDLLGENILRRGDFKLIVDKVLLGGVLLWRYHQKST